MQNRFSNTQTKRKLLQLNHVLYGQPKYTLFCRTQNRTTYKYIHIFIFFVFRFHPIVFAVSSLSASFPIPTQIPFSVSRPAFLSPGSVRQTFAVRRSFPCQFIFRNRSLHVRTVVKHRLLT